MYTNRGTKLFVSVLILLAVISTPMSHAHLAMEVFQNDVPFSIDVEPEKITVMPGDEIVFRIRIEAEEGFSDSIDLELRLSGSGVSITLDLGTLDPPYSKEFDVTVNIPSDIPEVNVQGILRGISGEHIVEKYLEINIQGKSGIMHAIWQIFDNLANGLAKIVRDKIQAIKDLIKEIWRIRGNSTDRDKILP